MKISTDGFVVSEFSYGLSESPYCDQRGRQWTRKSDVRKLDTAAHAKNKDLMKVLCSRAHTS
jgi:hypothetical protein